MEIIPDNGNRQEEISENNGSQEMNAGNNEFSQENSSAENEPVNHEHESVKTSAQEPEKTSDEEWAERLGLKYDPEIASRSVPPPYTAQQPPTPGAPAPPPPYHAATPVFNAYKTESEPMPKTYMLWSILSVVFCCFIPGIVAIIYSAQVSSRYYAKDYEGARRASERAQGWIIASIVLGVISAAFYLPLTLLGS